MKTSALILAAGLGTRMKSALPKVLHPILGDPSLLWVLRALPPGLEEAVVVLHHGLGACLQALENWKQQGLLPCNVRWVDQGQALGTGHAVRSAVEELDAMACEQILILSGDVPFIQSSTLQRLALHPAALLAMDLAEPGSYGRILQESDGRLARIVEAKDATSAEKAISRVNGGAYSLPWKPLKEALGRLKTNNAQGEYYLTDAVADLAQTCPVSVEITQAWELAGMNTRADLAQLQRDAQIRINQEWMIQGVTLWHPESAFIGPRVLLSRDVEIGPSVQLLGQVQIGESSRIGQGCIIQDSEIGPHVTLKPYCVLQGSRLEEGSGAGPFAHLREGSHLGPKARIGNFVETKKAKLHRGVKAGHLSYLGDCEIGEDTNVGAGCITCNYDGYAKHRTLVGREVFIGSDCQLVAPVTIGDRAMLGAGTTLTQDVPEDALALSRVRQNTFPDGAKKIRERKIEQYPKA